MNKGTMPGLSKKKNGVEIAWGFIIGLVILLISAGVILLVVKSSAGKADEKMSVEVCRTSNEVRVVTDSRWSPVHTPKICSTIDKTSNKLKVPSERYTQDKAGALNEMGDMLKDCWYMWLEGSDKKVFPSWWILGWGGTGCHICYKFIVEPVGQGFTLAELETSLKNRAYEASDTSNKCASRDGGGFLKSACGADEKEVPSILTNPGKCCVSTDPLNVCINKGGKCCTNNGGKCESSPGTIDTTYTIQYSKWLCHGNLKCFIKPVILKSYFDYLTDSTYKAKRGGRIEFEDFGANPAAISIYSGNGGMGDVFLRLTSLERAVNTHNCKEWN